MNTTDKLTDLDLQALSLLQTGMGSMARELLAHRRASQAAPVPSDEWAGLNCATGQTCTMGPHGPGGSIQCQYCGAEPTPAPSDALREALERLEAKASAVSSAHARKGNIGFAVAQMGPAIMSARAALSTPTEEAA